MCCNFLARTFRTKQRHKNYADLNAMNGFYDGGEVKIMRDTQKQHTQNSIHLLQFLSRQIEPNR